MRFERRADHLLWIGGPVPPGAAAMTIGALVIIRPKAVDDMHLLRHELGHVAQYRRLGITSFLVRYLLTYARFRALGWPHWAAYRRIPLEIEAEWWARRALVDSSPNRSQNTLTAT